MEQVRHQRPSLCRSQSSSAEVGGHRVPRKAPPGNYRGQGWYAREEKQVSEELHARMVSISSRRVTVLTILGTFYRLLICMSSNQPIAYILNLLSCPCIFRTRSLGRTLSLVAHPISLFSKDVKPDRCIEATPGFSGPRATTPC